ncbi:MAG: redoxin domain-containing protein [Saprospiraceae bacterium]
MKKIISKRKYKRTANIIVFLMMAVIQLLCSISSLFGQQLKGGDTIANFSFIAVSGIQYEYQDFYDKKVVLVFFRYAGSPSCNSRIHELREEYSQFRSDNFEVIVVFESTVETLKEYSADADLPFIVVADPELKLYKKFGVERSLGKTLKTIFKKKTKEARKNGKKLYGEKKYKKEGARTRIPAEFILEKSRVREANYGNYIGDYLPLYRINQF